jgi:hypothetical protein
MQWIYEYAIPYQTLLQITDTLRYSATDIFVAGLQDLV